MASKPMGCHVKGQRRSIGCYKSLSYSCKVWTMVLICIILIVAAMVLLYFLLIRHVIIDDITVMAIFGNEPWARQCQRRYNDTVDCYPENVNVHPDSCFARGCCYVDGTLGHSDSPRCVYPENFGYVFRKKVKASPRGLEVSLTRIPAPSRYGDDIHQVNVVVEMQTPYRLRIKFYDPVSERYEVPSPKIPIEKDHSSNFHSSAANLYNVEYNKSHSPFALKVFRADSGTVLFDSSIGALILSDHFLEVSSLLPSSNIYGLGAKCNEDNSTTMNFFANPTSKINGIHPMYICVENGGNSHGLLLLNSNALEIKLHSTPAITFRTIGGVLDFYIFLGPTPEDVVSQYTEAIGRPFLPPYWSLGLHLNFDNFFPVEDIEKSIEALASRSIPVEVVTCDSSTFRDYFKDAEEQISFSNIAKQLHKKSQRFMVTIRPAIKVEDMSSWSSAYTKGLRQKAFIFDKWAINPLRGMINGSEVVYPDYEKYATIKWWTDVISKLHRHLKFDGLLMVDNSPLSEVAGGNRGCMNDDLNRPPYVPGLKTEPLYSQTLCMDSIQHLKEKTYRHYDLHNLYGHFMVSSTKQSMDNLDMKSRKLIISESSYVGTGHHAGHLHHGVSTTWEGLKSSVSVLLDFSLSGISFVGSAIWGENEITEVDEELYLRWIQLGVFYPFSQIHNLKFNVIGEFSEDFFDSVRQAVSLRYQLLPYLYTLFYLAHTNGSTVMRPLFNEFPEDSKTYSIDSQFMWGPALLISPILQQNAVYQNFYLPGGVWYDFYTGEMTISKSEWLNRSATLYDEKPVPLHVKSGHIVALQLPSNTTTYSRKNPMKLLIALNETFEAEGFLFWDDGESIDSVVSGECITVYFSVKENILRINGNTRSKTFRPSIYIEHVQILGMPSPPKSITINDSYQVSHRQKHWHFPTQVLDIRPILIPLEGTTQVEWK